MDVASCARMSLASRCGEASLEYKASGERGYDAGGGTGAEAAAGTSTSTGASNECAAKSNSDVSGKSAGGADASAALSGRSASCRACSIASSLNPLARKKSRCSLLKCNFPPGVPFWACSVVRKRTACACACCFPAPSAMLRGVPAGSRTAYRYRPRGLSCYESREICKTAFLYFA